MSWKVKNSDKQKDSLKSKGLLRSQTWIFVYKYTKAIKNTIRFSYPYIFCI